MIDTVAWSRMKRETVNELAAFDLNQLRKSCFYDWRNAVSVDAGHWGPHTRSQIRLGSSGLRTSIPSGQTSAIFLFER